MSLNNIFLNSKLFLLIFTFVFLLGVVNYSIEILPVSGLVFLVSFVSVWVVSLFITLIAFHKMLLRNKPIDFEFSKYDSDKSKVEVVALKPDPDAVKNLAEDIDRYFITKWYQHISDNNDFTSESKCVLEEILNRLSEVLIQVNSKVLLQGILNIYLRHLKEFRRTLKRKEKYGGSIEELYRYSHICTSSQKSQTYYIHQLTINLLNHFINWELWNSLPCHTLVSIISRKFTLHMLNLLSNPHYLNYQVIKMIGSNAIKTTLNLDQYCKISFQEYYDVQNTRIMQEEANASSDVPDTCTSNGKAQPTNADIEMKDEPVTLTVGKEPERRVSIKEEIPIKEVKKTYLEKKNVVVDETATDPLTKSDPVKIHEPKSTMKIWNDSQDLVSVSFGMDPLDSFLTEEKPLVKSHWEKETSEQSPTSTTNLLLNEVRNITAIGEGLKISMKPISDATVSTLHNIKDLQETTVNNALTKIGDFQDEAAGMVEGILDFGRAGLRKGLRLTGLQDNIQNAKAVLSNSTTTSKTTKKPTKLIRSDSTEKNSSGESVDSCWINPLQSSETPNFDGQILLEKDKPSEDIGKPKDEVDFPQVPFISTESEDSPDPEYEEPADLESTIAKLRSLLQQKSSESNMSTPAISPMPPEEFSQKLAMNPEAVADLDEVDGVMPSFYKLCAKTAHGVLHKSINTIKTALPGNTADQILNSVCWKFLTMKESENDLSTRVHKLLSERKEYCKVDTAYEAIDSLESITQSSDIIKLEFEDELDDFEVKLPITKAIFDILCELLADTQSLLLQESMVKAILLSFGTTIEKSIVTKTDEFLQNLCVNLFRIPEASINETLYCSIETYISAISSSFPDSAKLIFTKENLHQAITLFVKSLQSERINEDIFLQIFELLSMKLIEESVVQVSPPASA